MPTCTECLKSWETTLSWGSSVFFSTKEGELLCYSCNALIEAQAKQRRNPGAPKQPRE